MGPTNPDAAKTIDLTADDYSAVGPDDARIEMYKKYGHPSNLSPTNAQLDHNQMLYFITGFETRLMTLEYALRQRGYLK